VACNARPETNQPLKNEQFNAIAGKDCCQKRLAQRRAASHQRNRGGITLQKIIMGQYRSALTLFAGVPTMKRWKAARSAVSARGVPFRIAVSRHFRP
jgi:hypothetical protein